MATNSTTQPTQYRPRSIPTKPRQMRLTDEEALLILDIRSRIMGGVMRPTAVAMLRDMIGTENGRKQRIARLFSPHQ